MGLDSLIQRNQFDRKSSLFPIYEAPNSVSGSFGGLGSNLSDTASLMAVTSDPWKATDYFASAPSNPAMNGTSIENLSLDRSEDFFENDTGTMKEVDAKSGPTEPEDRDLPFFGSESFLIISGTTEKTTSIESGRSYLSVFSAGAESSFFGATEKTAPTEPTECFSVEAASIFSATTETITQSENARSDWASIRDLFSPLSDSSSVTENLGSDTSAVNSLKLAVTTPVEVQRSENNLLFGSSLLSSFGDDETSQDETHHTPNKSDSDQEKDYQKNEKESGAAIGKGFFGLRRARATSKSTVMDASKGVKRPKDFPKSKKTVDGNEAINNRSVIALEDGDEKKTYSTINRSFRRHDSSGSLVENSEVAIEDGSGKKSKSAKTFFVGGQSAALV
jgi:hypothetical protein